MFWKRFYTLCKDRNITPNFVARELGLSSGSVTSWKKGKVPHHNTLLRIGEYFGVSVDFLLGSSVNSKNDRLYLLDKENIYMIPLFESVSAGLGTYPEEYATDYIPCYIGNPTEARKTICIKVNGDSMFPKIEEGDTIQVHLQSSVDSGAVAVVLIDGEEAVVKKVIYGTNFIELHSFNPMYPVRRFEDKEMLRVRIEGLVKKIIKDI